MLIKLIQKIYNLINYRYHPHPLPLSTRYRLSKKLEKFYFEKVLNRSNISDNTFIRIYVLKDIYKYLKDNYQYNAKYCGEDPYINEIIEYKEYENEISHHTLQMRLFKHFN